MNKQFDQELQRILAMPQGAVKERKLDEFWMKYQEYKEAQEQKEKEKWASKTDKERQQDLKNIAEEFEKLS